MTEEKKCLKNIPLGRYFQPKRIQKRARKHIKKNRSRLRRSLVFPRASHNLPGGPPYNIFIFTVAEYQAPGGGGRAAGGRGTILRGPLDVPPPILTFYIGIICLRGAPAPAFLGGRNFEDICEIAMRTCASPPLLRVNVAPDVNGLMCGVVLGLGGFSFTFL